MHEIKIPDAAGPKEIIPPTRPATETWHTCCELKACPQSHDPDGVIIANLQ